jgi:hypothetical protein
MSSRPTLRSTRPPIQRYWRLFPGDKANGGLKPAKKAWVYTSPPQYALITLWFISYAQGQFYQFIIFNYLIIIMTASVSSGQSFWLQIQRSGFYSQRYQIFWEVAGLERGPTQPEELLVRKSSGSGLESQEYGRREPSRWPRGTFYPRKLALTSPTSGGRSIGIVRSRTEATEFSLVFLIIIIICLVTLLLSVHQFFTLGVLLFLTYMHFATLT